MKRRFINGGLDGFEPHEVLELLLFYALPRGDTNPIAHRLIERFGSISGVLDAPLEELEKIEGIGESAAVLLKLLPQAARRYEISRSSIDNILNSTEKAGSYIVPRFYGERDEAVYVVCMDAKCQVIGCRKLFGGEPNSAAISIRKIVEYALSCNSTFVIIAHNHTSGIAIPSKEDEQITRMLRAALSAVDIELKDHIIVADGDYVSLADNGFFRI